MFTRGDLTSIKRKRGNLPFSDKQHQIVFRENEDG